MNKELSEEIWTKIERQQILFLEIESKLSNFGLISIILSQIDLLKNNYKNLIESIDELNNSLNFDAFTHKAYTHCQHNLTNYFASVGICIDVTRYQVEKCTNEDLKKAIKDHAFFTYVPIISVGKSLRNHSTHRSNLDFILKKEVNYSTHAHETHDPRVFLNPR